MVDFETNGLKGNDVYIIEAASLQLTSGAADTELAYCGEIILFWNLILYAYSTTSLQTM